MKRFFEKIRRSRFFNNPYIRMTIAIISLIIGILGLILPIAPGIPFLLFGLYLINPIWYRKIYEKIKGYIKTRKSKPPESQK